MCRSIIADTEDDALIYKTHSRNKNNSALCSFSLGLYVYEISDRIGKGTLWNIDISLLSSGRRAMELSGRYTIYANPKNDSVLYFGRGEVEEAKNTRTFDARSMISALCFYSRELQILF